MAVMRNKNNSIDSDGSNIIFERAWWGGRGGREGVRRKGESA